MITEYEIKWIEENLRELNVNAERTEVSGDLEFTAAYDKTIGFVWLIKPDQTAAGEILSDKYRIRIQATPDKNNLPILKIEGDKPNKTIDRHFYNNGTACLCGPVERYEFLQSGFSFIKYLDKLVVPFLYEQTYFDKYPGEWPWGEYAHGSAGIFESFAKSEGTREHVEACLEELRKDKNNWERVRAVLLGQVRVTETSKCFCTSPDQIRRCHPDAWSAMYKLRSAIRKYGMPMKK